MTVRFIEYEAQRTRFIEWLLGQDLPLTITATKGRKRSIEQNRLQRLWVKEASEQLDGWLPEDVRGFCKLHFGVPILCAQNEEFQKKYERIIRPLAYQQQIELMKIPLDLPVTRIMTVKQKTEYLDQMCRHLSGEGVRLTIPDDMFAEPVGCAA